MKEELNKELLGEKVNFGGIHYHSTSGHIYSNDMKAAKKLIAINKELNFNFFLNLNPFYNKKKRRKKSRF